MPGGPSAGCAGWDGAGWFPLLQLKSKDGQRSKSESFLSDAATPTEKLKHTSVLTRSVLWFGYRCDPFGLKTGDTDQY